MRKILLATAALLVSLPAQAVTLDIFYERPDCCVGVFTNVGSATDPATGTLTANFTSGTWTVAATEWAQATNINLGSVAAFQPFPYSGEAISVYIRISDITSPYGPAVNFLNSMTFDFPTDAGWYVNATTYINNQYLNPPQIFTTPGTYILNASFDTTTLLSPYSITQFYGFQANPATVPAPIVGAGIPGLAALAMLWLARRRKRGQQTTI